MKALSLFLLIGTSFALAQSAAPPTAGKPDTVIAIFEDGSKMTLGEFQALVPVLPDHWRSIAEQNPERFLHLYGVLLKGAAMAQSQKLAERNPYKQGLAFAIMSTLADFEVRNSTSSITVTPAEVEKYYDEHKEPYKRIKVSGIRVAFGGTSAPADNSSSVMASRVPKKILTEDEAKAKADKLVAQLRAGADFAKMVQLESDDETSKAKGGDFGSWSMTDNVPNDMRLTVLSLKEGDVSEPLKQAGGYYIFHADAVTYAPLADVRDSIFDQLQQEKGREWIQNFDKSTKVELPKNQEPPPPAAPSDPKK
jgi:hypothetical protein